MLASLHPYVPDWAWYFPFLIYFEWSKIKARKAGYEACRKEHNLPPPDPCFRSARTSSSSAP